MKLQTTMQRLKLAVPESDICLAINVDESLGLFVVEFNGSLTWENMVHVGWCPQRIGQMLGIRDWVNEPADLPSELKTRTGNVPVKLYGIEDEGYFFSLWNRTSGSRTVPSVDDDKSTHQVGVNFGRRKDKRNVILASVALHAYPSDDGYCFKLVIDDDEERVATDDDGPQLLDSGIEFDGVGPLDQLIDEQDPDSGSKGTT